MTMNKTLVSPLLKYNNNNNNNNNNNSPHNPFDRQDLCRQILHLGYLFRALLRIFSNTLKYNYIN